MNSIEILFITWVVVSVLILSLGIYTLTLSLKNKNDIKKLSKA